MSRLTLLQKCPQDFSLRLFLVLFPVSILIRWLNHLQMAPFDVKEQDGLLSRLQPGANNVKVPLLILVEPPKTDHSLVACRSVLDS